MEKTDRDMLGGLLDLKELEVSDVMVHPQRCGPSMRATAVRCGARSALVALHTHAALAR